MNAPTTIDTILKLEGNGTLNTISCARFIGATLESLLPRLPPRARLALHEGKQYWAGKAGEESLRKQRGEIAVERQAASALESPLLGAIMCYLAPEELVPDRAGESLVYFVQCVERIAPQHDYAQAWHRAFDG